MLIDSRSYLSSKSLYPFVLDGKTWVTVAHYVQSRKFEGTEKEEKVRRSLTPHLAERMDRRRVKCQRDGYNVEKVISEVDKEIWEEKYYDYLLRATTAKFKQNPMIMKRLLEVGDDIESFDEPDLPEILLLIRDKEIYRLNKEKDVKSPRLTKSEKQFILNIIDVIDLVRQMERLEEVHSGMAEDAFYNMTNKITIDDFFQWEMGCNEKISKMPNHHQMLLSIENVVKKQSLSKRISYIIKFMRERKVKEWNVPIIENIKLYPKKRSYRK